MKEHRPLQLHGFTNWHGTLPYNQHHPNSSLFMMDSRLHTACTLACSVLRQPGLHLALSVCLTSAVVPVCAGGPQGKGPSSDMATTGLLLWQCDHCAPHTQICRECCPHTQICGECCPHTLICRKCCPHTQICSECCPHTQICSECCPAEWKITQHSSAAATITAGGQHHKHWPAVRRKARKGRAAVQDVLQKGKSWPAAGAACAFLETKPSTC